MILARFEYKITINFSGGLLKAAKSAKTLDSGHYSGVISVLKIIMLVPGDTLGRGFL